MARQDHVGQDACARIWWATLVQMEVDWRSGIPGSFHKSFELSALEAAAASSHQSASRPDELLQLSPANRGDGEALPQEESFEFREVPKLPQPGPLVQSENGHIAEADVKIGSRVVLLFEAEHVLGEVLSRSDDGTFRVALDDGECAERVATSQLRSAFPKDMPRLLLVGVKGGREGSEDQATGCLGPESSIVLRFGDEEVCCERSTSAAGAEWHGALGVDHAWRCCRLPAHRAMLALEVLSGGEVQMCGELAGSAMVEVLGAAGGCQVHREVWLRKVDGGEAAAGGERKEGHGAGEHVATPLTLVLRVVSQWLQPDQ